MKYAILFVFAICFSACQKESETLATLDNSTALDLTDAEMLFLQKNGLTNLSKTTTSTEIIIGGDMVIIRSDINDGPAGPGKPGGDGGEKHYTYPVASLPSVLATTNIKYFVDPSVGNLQFGSDWETAITQAAIDFSDIQNCATTFVPTQTSSDATIRITAANISVGRPAGDPIPYADARLPLNGNIGSLIRINSAPNRPISTLAGKTEIMIHEFAHTIGIQHTDGNNGSLQTEFWRCTTDGNSIMNSSTNANTLNTRTLTAGDRLLLTTLFPEIEEFPHYELIPTLVDEFIDGTRVFDVQLQIQGNNEAIGGNTTTYTVEKTLDSTYEGDTDSYTTTFNHTVNNNGSCNNSGTQFIIESQLHGGGEGNLENCVTVRIRANYRSRDNLSPWGFEETFCVN